MPYTTEVSQGRDFFINQPNVGATKAVMFCHGYGGNGASVAVQLGNPDSTDYYLVFPNGVVTNPAEPNKLHWRSANTLGSLSEVGYFADIALHLTDLGVTEITIAGHSNGASMAALLVALHPTMFNKAFCVSNFLTENTAPLTGDTPMRFVHGLNDTIVPIDGGQNNIITNMEKFKDAGHIDSETLVLNQGHDLAELNTDNRIINELENFMGV